MQFCNNCIPCRSYLPYRRTIHLSFWSSYESINFKLFHLFVFFKYKMNVSSFIFSLNHSNHEIDLNIGWSYLQIPCDNMTNTSVIKWELKLFLEMYSFVKVTFSRRLFHKQNLNKLTYLFFPLRFLQTLNYAKKNFLQKLFFIDRYINLSINSQFTSDYYGWFCTLLYVFCLRRKTGQPFLKKGYYRCLFWTTQSIELLKHWNKYILL